MPDLCRLEMALSALEDAQHYLSLANLHLQEALKEQAALKAPDGA